MIFQRSTRREFTQSAAGVFVALFAILLTTQLIRFLGEAARGAISPEAVVALLGFSALNYIPTLLSLAAFIAILLSLSRSYRDSEMVVWFSSGVSLAAWLRPVFVFMAPLVVVIGALSLYASPWAQSRSAEYRRGLDGQHDTGQAVPGEFQESSSGKRVVFVEAIGDDATFVRNVFVATTEDGRTGVTMADRGYQEFANSGDRFVVLENGKRYEVMPGSPEFRVLEYERYAVRIEAKEIRGVEKTPKNTPTSELLKSDDSASKGELLWRLSLPISALVLAMMAIPMSFVNPRAGRSANLLFALVTYVVYNNLITVSQAWVAAGKVSFLSAMFGVHVFMLALLPILFFRRIAVRARGLFGQ